ncbi:hypothetical protein KL944_004094 [Ogataea haglerorum]|nr:hypothetical protein KL944_004094 [Ogataea haglerorum]
MALVSEGPPKKRSKRRDGPPFKCDFPNCNKEFLRSEHLSRHQLNHNPKKIFRCPRCDKTFVRNDLLVRHERRHSQRDDSKSSPPKQLSSVNTIVRTHNSSAPTPSPHMGENPTPNLLSWLFSEDPESLDAVNSSNMDSAEIDQMFANNGQAFFLLDGFENISSNSALFSDQPISIGSTETSYMKNEYELNDVLLAEFKTLIPALATHPDFLQFKLEKMLRTYWKYFHPRFPILHKPTFVASQTPPSLLLSMFIIGARLSTIFDDLYSPDHIEDPQSFADLIANPLRWHIFSSPDFEPPATIWTIQSLLLLEFYEKNCSSRKMHERAHLHHGTTIQLLRRLPTLGGTPQKLGQPEDVSNWHSWIEVESLKRATYMCFYMDTIDAIMYGHEVLIYAHQVQLTMPVEDEVWDADLRNFKQVIKQAKKPQRFLLVLKNLLNGVSTRTNAFGKKVLVSGLSAVMFQIQQRDLQLAFGLDKFGASETAKNWRELMTAAYSIWRNDVGVSCCSSKTAIENVKAASGFMELSQKDTRCKCTVYHMAHVCMSIPQYDFLIFAGAPWRMNVKPSSPLERDAICKRVLEWTETRHAKVAVVQCYLLLFEMFLSPQGAPEEYEYDYDADRDLFFRSNPISIALLVVWTYVFIKCGRETYKPQLPKESGYQYLRRIRSQFSSAAGCVLETTNEEDTGSQLYGKVKKWTDVLDSIPDKQNLVGLLGMVGHKMANARYSIVKELGKLIVFCARRSSGSSQIILYDMYD